MKALQMKKGPIDALMQTLERERQAVLAEAVPAR